MATAPSELRFCWWNVQDFAHFDPLLAIDDRWPKSAKAFRAKRDALSEAFDRLYGADTPGLIGLGEVTEPAGRELQARRFSGYELAQAVGTDFQTAVFIKPGARLRELPPLAARDVPPSTRVMPVVEYRTRTTQIRFVFCHWTAFGERSQLYRERLAEAVRIHAYQFLFAPRQSAAQRHMVVLGDLNVEPFDSLFDDRLPAVRAHREARRRHGSDPSVRRVRFYNCGWRSLGETHPHTAAVSVARWAGTHYHPQYGWRTVDQILVTGGLLAPAPPYLDEASVRIMGEEFLLPNGVPAQFDYNNGKPFGLSDHLPICGRILLG